MHFSLIDFLAYDWNWAVVLGWSVLISSTSMHKTEVTCTCNCRSEFIR